MKKIISIALSFILVFAFICGCAQEAEPPVTDAPPATEAPTEAPPADDPDTPPAPAAKVFESEGFSITLSENFEEYSTAPNVNEWLSDYTAAFISEEDDVGVLVLMENYAKLNREGVSTVISAVDYAQTVVERNEHNCRAEFSNDLAHFIYNQDDNAYFAVALRGEEAYWVFRFYTAISNYLRMEEQFKAWAKTIDIGYGAGVSVAPPDNLEERTVYYYDTYGDIASDPSIMWGDKGWGGWVKNELVDEGGGWYSFVILSPNVTEHYNMLIFFNGLPDSDPDAIQWVWHIDRGEPNGLIFVADMENPENPPANNYQGWQRDCTSFATMEEALDFLGVE